MLTKFSLLFPVAALALPLLSAAQAVPTAGPDGPATRRSPTFYLGVAAATGLLRSPDGFSGTPTGPSTYNHVPLLPKLTVGWQLLPRLALQLSGQYAQQNDTYSYVLGLQDAAGQVALVPGFHSFRLHSVAVPVLARYTLTSNSTSRFQADLLGGATLVRRSTQYQSQVYLPSPDGTPPPAGTTPETTAVAYKKSTTDVHLSLGPSFRYRVAPRWQVVADVVANYCLTEDPIGSSAFSPNKASTRNALTGSLGVLYGLGVH
jgi:hypothetical protein